MPTKQSWEAEWHRANDTLRDPDTGYWTIEAEMLGRAGVVADTLNRDHTIDPEEDRKNAKLLAAAPDLLAACESALDLIDNRGNLRFMESAALLKNAIGKAK